MGLDSLERKLDYAEKIFVWAREFSRTDTYRRLLNLINLRPPECDKVYVNGGGWAHEQPYSEVSDCSLCFAYIAKFARRIETGEVYDIIRKWHLEKW